MKRHIESFTRIESRYTRRDTRRLYLDQALSISKTYALYRKECEVTNSPVASVKEGFIINFSAKNTINPFFALKRINAQSAQNSKCTRLSQFLLHPVAMWKTSMEVTTIER